MEKVRLIASIELVKSDTILHMNSSPTYTLVTKHWPKIATGCVVGIGLMEFVVGGFYSDSTLEFYFLAWGGMTAGAWFLFDTAEKSSTTNSKHQTASWIKASRNDFYFRDLPEKFAVAFDSIFGARHLSWLCFRRSTIASILAAWTISAIVYGIAPGKFGDGFVGSNADLIISLSLTNIGVLGLLALFVNIIPDYLSLLQTRYMLQFIKDGASIVLVLIADIFLTALIFISFISIGTLLLSAFFLLFLNADQIVTSQSIWEMSSGALGDFLSEITFSSPRSNSVGILFITTFFTSVWLWLYILSIAMSRFLIQFNSGVGILLNVVDVETQPFRSLGFVSVLLVSGLFLLGLPFVIWG